ncbi:MAG: hypothetical protein QM820_51660 [Minicystis sp.]
MKSSVSSLLHWSAVRAWHEDPETGNVVTLSGRAAVLALAQWRVGAGFDDVCFVDISGPTTLSDPAVIDWRDFPTGQDIELHVRVAKALKATAEGNVHASLLRARSTALRVRTSTLRSKAAEQRARTEVLKAQAAELLARAARITGR